MRRKKSDILKDTVKFSDWCMKECMPGFGGCVYRRHGGITWLNLKKKCDILNGKKRRKRNKRNVSKV